MPITAQEKAGDPVLKTKNRLTIRAKKPSAKKLDRRVVRAKKQKRKRILPDPWEIVPYVGYTQFRPDTTYSDAMTMGVAIQYPLNDRTQVQFRLDSFRSSKSDEPSVSVYSNTGYALEGKYLVGENYKFKAYVLSGTALESFESSPYLYAGAALHFVIGKKEFPLTLRFGRSSSITFGIQNYLF